MNEKQINGTEPASAGAQDREIEEEEEENRREIK